MNCEQIRPYLPGFVGGDLRADTSEVVSRHVETCKACRADATTLARVGVGLSQLATKEIEPPAYLFDAIMEQTTERASRRVLAPVLPISMDEVARLVSDHRDAITSAAGVAVVAAGAAYALWRAVRGRTTTQPATS